jgi:hypothetical protein
MSHFYGIISISSGVRALTDNIGAAGLSGVLIGNESGLTVIITLQGANTSKSLYPGTVDWFPIPKSGFTGVVQIDPVSNLNNLSFWPSSFVQIDTFGINEAPAGVYPMALPRITNVGNTVTTTGGTVAQVVNDGNAPATQFIESTVSGDGGGSAVSVTNDGVVAIGTTLHKGSITIKGPISADGTQFRSDGVGNVNVGATLTVGGGYVQSGGDMSLGTHDITASNNITSNGTITANFITCDGGYTQGGGDMAIGAHNISSCNNITCSGTLTLNTGTLSRLKVFNGTGNSTVNTGLGTTPTTICWNDCTVSGSSQTIGGTNAQSSVVTTGAGLAWNGTAIKT